MPGHVLICIVPCTPPGCYLVNTEWSHESLQIKQLSKKKGGAGGGVGLLDVATTNATSVCVRLWVRPYGCRDGKVDKPIKTGSGKKKRKMDKD